jgi:hypothetical protein
MATIPLWVLQLIACIAFLIIKSFLFTMGFPLIEACSIGILAVVALYAEVILSKIEKRN